MTMSLRTDVTLLTWTRSKDYVLNMPAVDILKLCCCFIKSGERTQVPQLLRERQSCVLSLTHKITSRALSMVGQFATSLLLLIQTLRARVLGHLCEEEGVKVEDHLVPASLQYTP